jgi:tetratricopeptide (TPR) repeat protein
MFYFVQDAAKFLMNIQGGVAVMAHLSGTVFGFIVGMTLLWTRLLSREPYDMISLWEHRRRRSRFRAMARQGYQPWESSPASRQGPPLASPADARPPTPAELRVMEKRAEVARALASMHYERAGELYAELLDLDGSAVLSQPQQFDLANHLVQSGRYELAARAYEILLNTYRSFPDRERAELMLAVLYVRYLQRWQRARELIAAALPRLRHEQDQMLARELHASLHG